MVLTSSLFTFFLKKIVVFFYSRCENGNGVLLSSGEKVSGPVRAREIVEAELRKETGGACALEIDRGGCRGLRALRLDPSSSFVAPSTTCATLLRTLPSNARDSKGPELISTPLCCPRPPPDQGIVELACLGPAWQVHLDGAPGVRRSSAYPGSIKLDEPTPHHSHTPSAGGPRCPALVSLPLPTYRIQCLALHLPPGPLFLLPSKLLLCSSNQEIFPFTTLVLPRAGFRVTLCLTCSLHLLDSLHHCLASLSLPNFLKRLHRRTFHPTPCPLSSSSLNHASLVLPTILYLFFSRRFLYFSFGLSHLSPSSQLLASF